MERSHASQSSLPGKKPSFADLCFQYNIDVTTLFRATFVSPEVIWAMLLEQEVKLDLAISVLGAFNDLAHTQYQLDQLQIKLIERTRP